MEPNSRFENSKSSHVRSQRGTGLIEVLIATAIMVGLGLGFATLMRDSQLSANNTHFRLDATTVEKEIRSELGYKESCTNTFGGLPVTGPQNVTRIIGRANPPGSPPPQLYRVGEKYGSNTVILKSMTLQNFATTSTPRSWVASLFIYFDTAKQAMGAQTVGREIKMALVLDTGNRIESCVSLSEAADSLWRRSDFNLNNIFYAGGNVGVGANDPRSELHVAGMDGTPQLLFRPDSMLLNQIASIRFEDPDSGTTPMSIEYRDDGTPDLAIMGGNLGISTHVPAGKLDIVNHATLPEIYLSGAGTSNIVSNTGTAMFLNTLTNTPIHLGTAGSGNAHLSIANGNVGVGVAAPIHKFQVVGNASVAGTLGVEPPNFLSLHGPGSPAWAGMRSNGGIEFFAGNAQRMLVATGGNVGIGVAAPAAKLHVAGTVGVDPGHWFSLWGGSPAWMGMRANNGIEFFTSNNPRMLIRADGFVGIGEPNPQAKLHIDDMGTAQPSFRIDSNSPRFIELRRMGDRNATIRYMNDNGSMYAGLNGQANWGIDRNTDLGANPHLVVTRALGYVGINIGNPQHQLDVRGEINARGGWPILVNDNPVCRTAGCITPSDRNLKTNITPLENSLEKILQLQGVAYEWKDKKTFGEGPQIGLIAQDLEKVFPQVVHTHKNLRGRKTVSYDNLIGPIVEAIKELWKMITDLGGRTETLEKELASVKAENAELKAYLCAKDPEAPICK